MKHKITILFFLSIAYCYSQKNIKITNGCFLDKNTKRESITISPCLNLKVNRILNDILGAVSLEKNFELYEASINNAVATIIDDERVIIVDLNFLDSIENITSDKYTSYFIIAHEIGHHLNSHIANDKYGKHFWSELEADNFAGAIIYKLGISPKTIHNVVSLVSNEVPKLSEFTVDVTHPEWQARMKAAINGYCKSSYVDTKKKVNTKLQITTAIIESEEKQLEIILNKNIYLRNSNEKNIIYKVKNRGIVRSYETNFYNDKENSSFIKKEEFIDIENINNVNLLWHDPGLISFSDLIGNSYAWALQGQDAQKKLNSNFYFDNSTTVFDDLSILTKIYNSIGKIQKYIELTK